MRTRALGYALGAALLAALAACQSTPPAGAPAATAKPPAKAKAARPVPPPFKPKPMMTAHHRMVVTANPLASAAGLKVLRDGGSAVDAVIAAQMVLGVVEPQSSGLGGGAFLMHYEASSGKVTFYDGRETAPAAATEDLFLNPDGSPRSFYDAAVSGLSVGVPGVLRLAELAHFKHGRLDWPALFRPAIEIAEDGFRVSPRLHELVAADKYLPESGAAARYFLGPDGKAKPVGTLLKNPALADTLRRVAEMGAQAFYEGDIADDIVAAVRGNKRHPGRLAAKDLATYRAKEREPVCSLYRKWVVCGGGPPTSGGVATLQILGLLQRFDMSALEPGSAEAAHLIAEAERLAFADRNVYLADTDFIDVPVARLIDPGYLSRRARLIDPAHAMEKVPAGSFEGRASLFGPGADRPGYSTSHISAVDDAGNVASMTTSVESAFGSRIMVRGFILNNQLTDFNFLPVKNGKVIANRVGPGKRPRSSMSPTLVLDGTGKPVLATGSPGGSRIIGYVVQSILGVLDWGMTAQEAVEQPHVVSTGGAISLEAGTAAAKLKAPLEAMGHKVRVRPLTSGLGLIKITPEAIEGGADPRREGIAYGD